MSAERQRLRPWLEDRINSGKVPGLSWRNKELKEFRVSWKHAGKPDFVVEKDAMLFKLWAEHTGKYRPGESADPSTWKTRFRCALHKMPDVEEVRVPHSLDEKEPYRVFRFKEKADGSPKRNSNSPQSDETHPRRSLNRPNSDSVIRAAPRQQDNIFFNNYPVMTGSHSYGSRLQDSPQHDSSDSSIEDDIDLDNITPTLPPYPSHAYEPMLTDEQACGNSSHPFPSYSNGLGYLNGDFLSNSFMRQLPSSFENLGLNSFGKEMVEAILAANGQLANGSVFGENSPAFLQHVVATNPAFLMNMKLWLQGGGFSDESPDGSPSVSTHLNMDNGLIEPSSMEMDDTVGRMVTIPHLNDSSASLFSRSGKSTGESNDFTAMHIRVFYGSCEVYSTDTRLTESERVIRIFHGGHLGESRQYELSLLCKLYGPPTARQIELPQVNNCSKETMKVMEFLKRGILLEINEDHEIFVTRLCLTRVFYSNGRKVAKKVEREDRTKVFDYQGKFLPTLRESRNGSREYPSYDVTLYLGRPDGSLVSIVITHVMAKMSLHNASTAGENFWSEPNLNDQLATNLEEDCMY